MKFPVSLKAACVALALFPINNLFGADKPNVLFITVDDLKPLMGAYGNDVVPTPNMDRLAARGTVMLNSYCQQAICAPSRMSAFTGLRPDSTKVWDLRTNLQDANPDAVTIQQWFKEAGYTTAGAGKVMHGARGEHPESWSNGFTSKKDLPFNKAYPMPAHDNGFYQNEKSQAVYQEMLAKDLKGWKARFDYLKDNDAMPATECLDVPDDAYVDGALTTWAEDLLENYAKSKESFFLTVGYCKPHLPFVAPKKYWDMFDRDEIDLAEFRERAAGSPDFAYHQFGELRSYTDIGDEWNLPVPDDKQLELIHGYYACVAFIDAQIGKLLDTLDETGLSKNTIIVLWGDHGYHLGDHGMWNKHSNFEQATSAPLIITAPGFNGNQKAEAMAEMVDMFPTLVELAGLEAPYGLEGDSLVPVLKDPSASVKDYAISQYPRGGGRMGYALRTPQYRLVVWMKNNWVSTKPYDPSYVEAVELYDYKKDPLETKNLYNDPAYASVQAELQAKMLEYFAEYAEPVVMPAASNSVSVAPKADGELFDVKQIPDSQLDLRFATAEKTADGLKVNFEDNPKWPSVEFIAPDGKAWDVSGYGQLDITFTNNSAFPVKTSAWLANPGDNHANQKRNSNKIDIGAGATETLTIPFDPSQFPLNLKDIKTIRMFIIKQPGPVEFVIHSIKPSGTGAVSASAAPAAHVPPASSSASSADSAKVDASGELLDLSDANKLKTDLRFSSVSSAPDGVVMDIELSPKWPSVEFFPSSGEVWDLSKYRYVDATITNMGENQERVFIYLSNPAVSGQKKKTIGSGRVDFKPGETKTIRLEMSGTDGFDLSKTDAFRVFTGMHKNPVKLKLTSLKAVQ